MSRQTTLLDDAQDGPRPAWSAEEAKVEKARAAVAVQRKAARREPRPQAGARAAPPPQARAAVATLVVRARAAQAAAARARRADLRQLRVAKKQENRIRQLIIERARRQHGGYQGDTGGFLFRPVPGLRHLAVRLAPSTRSTATGACTTAPTSTPPAAPPSAPPAPAP